MIFGRFLPRAVIIAALALAFAPAGRAADDNARCLMCHSAPGLSKTSADGKQVSLQVDEKEFKESVHGNRLCTDCHVDLAGQPLPHKQDVKPVMCSRCHHMGNTDGAPNFSPMDEYKDSVHGKAAARGDKDAPRCKDCHGTHGVRAPNDPKSTVYKRNIPKTCSKCHSDSRIVAKHDIPVKQPLKYYERSVHGRAVEEQGLLAAAVCTDCHGAHDIKAANNAASSVNKPNIPSTCGKCHTKIYEQYERGIHGQAVARGIKDAPVCTDCHGEHTIQAPSQPGSSVYPTHVVATCSKCHENQRIQRRYGLPANRLKSYVGSYHGVANKFGETTVANCATCHGAHDILPSKDPRSAVNKKNLPHTCGKCHPGAGTNFAKGSIHVIPSPTKDKEVYWVRAFYSVFIVGLIGSFGMYIVLDLRNRWRRRRPRR